MDEKKYIAHINSSPWVEDGEWHIVIDRGYICFGGVDTDHAYKTIEMALQSALDRGIIHSYYIQRASDKKPVSHIEDFPPTQTTP